MTQLDRIEAMLTELLERKKPKPKRSNVLYTSGFAGMWNDDYPQRSGSNSKSRAFTAYGARIDEGVSHKELRDGVQRYRVYCEANGSIGTEYVMQASRFFGPGREFENEWIVPDKTESMPKSNDDLVAWSANKGFRTPRAGESWSEYRQAVNELYRNV